MDCVTETGIYTVDWEEQGYQFGWIGVSRCFFGLTQTMDGICAVVYHRKEYFLLFQGGKVELFLNKKKDKDSLQITDIFCLFRDGN